MKTADVEIVIVPGWSSSGPDHWQSRWQRNLPNTCRVEQDDWVHATKDAWVGNLIEVLAPIARPTIIVAHSVGVITLAHAAREVPKGTISAAFLVAPADVERADQWPVTNGHTFDHSKSGFAPIPDQRFDFPTTLVASSNDPYCSFERAETFATRWGADFINAGDLGHINISSGHGPWPEGLLRFGKFLQALG